MNLTGMPRALCKWARSVSEFSCHFSKGISLEFLWKFESASLKDMSNVLIAPSERERMHIKMNMWRFGPSFGNGLTTLIPRLLSYVTCAVIARVTSSFSRGLGEIIIILSLRVVTISSSSMFALSLITGFDTRI